MPSAASRGADQVEARAAWARRDSGISRARADRGDQAERQVDEEDQPPAAAERVGVDQRAADDRTQHRRQADHRPEHGERLDPAPSGANASRMIPRPCGISSAAAAPWASRQAISISGSDRERARHRRGHEAERAEHEQPLAAVDVAEPAARDQADRERERVAADDPLQRGRAGVQVGRGSWARRR